MSNLNKGSSYWSVRRKVRANLISRLNEIEQDHAESVENNEVLVERQASSNHQIENVPAAPSLLIQNHYPTAN